MSVAVRRSIAAPRLIVGFGAILAAVYVMLVLTSTDYPYVVWGWTPPVQLGFSYNWIFVLTAMPPILAGLVLIKRSPWPSRWARAFWIAWVIHVLFETVAAIISVAPIQSLIVYVARDAALGFLFLALTRNDADQPLRLLAFVLVSVGLVQICVALVQELPGFLVLGPGWLIERWTLGIDFGELRSAGLTGYSTILGALLVTTLPLAGLVSLSNRTRLLLWAFGIAVVLLSGVRGCVLGIGAGLLVAAVIALSGRTTVHRKVLAIAVLVIAAAGGTLGMYPAVLSRVNSATRAFDEQVAWAVWSAHPWVGAGPGNFAWAARQLPQYSTIEERVEPVHNWLLLRLAEGGVVGAAIALVLWIGPVLWLLFRGEGFKDAVLAVSFTAFAVSQWFDYEMLYWIGGAVIQVLLLALWLGPGGRSAPELTPERGRLATRDWASSTQKV